MPISERELRSYVPHDAVIIDDRACRRCGYNLKGLHLGGDCPECGTTIRRKMWSRRHTRIDEAPLSYLRRLYLTTMLLAWTGFFGIVLLLTPGQFTTPVVQGLGIVVAIWWCIGVYVVGLPIPLDDLTGTELTESWTRWRRGALALQPAWVLLSLVPQQWATGPYAFVGHVLFVVAILGVVALTVQLSNLADWAQHSTLGDRLRGVAWALVLGTFGWYGIDFVGGLIGGFVGGIVRIVGFLFVLMHYGALLFLVISLAQLAGMCKWAGRNALHRFELNEAMRDRAERA